MQGKPILSGRICEGRTRMNLEIQFLPPTEMAFEYKRRNLSACREIAVQNRLVQLPTSNGNKTDFGPIRSVPLWAFNGNNSFWAENSF